MSHPKLSELDPATVGAFLRERLGGEIDSVERIKHGEWSKAFGFRQVGDGEYVVRFSATDEDFMKDRQVMRLAPADLPVPNVLEIGESFGGFFAISERAYGAFLETLDAAGMHETLPSLLATLNAARRVDLSTTSGFGVWNARGAGRHASWREALAHITSDVPSNRTYGWRERLSQSSLAVYTLEKAERQIHRLLDFCPEERHLLHSDLLYFNVLVEDCRVGMLLDWGSSMFGDFLWDLAWLTLWQPWYTAWADVDIRGAALRHYAEIGLDVPNFEQRMRCYELCIGVDGLAYQAFAGHWSNLEWTARRVLGLLG